MCIIKFFWNSFTSHIFDINIRVGQGSALFPILLILYLSPFSYIIENHLKNLKILISIISFVNDSLFIFQSKSFQISNSYLFCSYNVITNLLAKFSFIVKHLKTEVFYFNKSQGSFNSLFFDRKLSFYNHINFYSNKVMFMIKSIKILGNSNWDINFHQKHF